MVVLLVSPSIAVKHARRLEPFFFFLSFAPLSKCVYCPSPLFRTLYLPLSLFATTKRKWKKLPSKQEWSCLPGWPCLCVSVCVFMGVCLCVMFCKLEWIIRSQKIFRKILKFVLELRKQIGPNQMMRFDSDTNQIPILTLFYLKHPHFWPIILKDAKMASF